MSLVRLHVLVEGQTEEGFVKRLLAPELAARDVYLTAHRITTGRHHGQASRGGLVRYAHLARDLTRWMKQDGGAECWFTTMIDFYGLPDDFPEFRASAAQPSANRRIEALETAFGEDIRRRLDGHPVQTRFLPFIQMHEFEALLFSRPEAFLEAFPGDEKLVRDIAVVTAQFATPEDIDDGPKTAPSKRILAVARGYQKPVAGLLIAERIGIAAMRSACPRFDIWVARLLALAEGSGGRGASPEAPPT